MNQATEVLEQEWSVSLVILSALLAFWGAYSAVTLTELYRVSHKYKLKVFNKDSILVLAAIAIAGGAIWSMHFIGMEALTLKTSTGKVVPVCFDIGLTVISFLSAVCCAYVGLWISVRDKLFTKDGDAIVDHLVKEMRGLQSMKDKNKVLQTMLLNGLVPLALGGICTACGVCVMHYIGMLAMQADAMMVWSGGIVFVSCVIAIVAASAAEWILFRVLAIYPTFELLRCACAVVVMVAVLAMHYTGMAAATYEYRPNSGTNAYSTGATIGGLEAAYTAIIFNVGFNLIIQHLVLMEYRSLYYNLQAYERQFLSLTKIGRFLHEDFMAKFNTTYQKLKYSSTESASVVPEEDRDALAKRILEEFNAIPASKSQVKPSDSYVSMGVNSNSSYQAAADVEEGVGLFTSFGSNSTPEGKSGGPGGRRFTSGALSQLPVHLQPAVIKANSEGQLHV